MDNEEAREIDVTIEVEGVEVDETHERVLDVYEETIETFIRKNIDYGSSFDNSAKVESILKHGEIRDDDLPQLVSRQIFVRGFLDKISRFYQLAFENDDAMVEDEDLDDTLRDLGNYAIMLASELRKYSSQ